MIVRNLRRANEFFPVWLWDTVEGRPASLRVQKGPEVTIGAKAGRHEGLWWHNDEQPKLVIFRGWPTGFTDTGRWWEDAAAVQRYLSLVEIPEGAALPC